MNMPAVPDCDCGGMLECLGILLHRQGCEAQRRLLAEGELGRRSVRVRKRKCRMPRDSYIPEPEQSGTAGIFIPRPGIQSNPNPNPRPGIQSNPNPNQRLGIQSKINPIPASLAEKPQIEKCRIDRFHKKD